MTHAVVQALVSLIRCRMAPRSTRQTGSQRKLGGNARSFLSRYIVMSMMPPIGQSTSHSNTRCWSHHQRSKGANLLCLLDVRGLKCFQLQGALPPDPLTTGSATGPRWGLRRRPPAIGLNSPCGP